MVFELPYSWLEFFALFATVFFTWKLGLALLKQGKKKQRFALGRLKSGTIYSPL